MTNINYVFNGLSASILKQYVQNSNAEFNCRRRSSWGAISGNIETSGDESFYASINQDCAYLVWIETLNNGSGDEVTCTMHTPSQFNVRKFEKTLEITGKVCILSTDKDCDLIFG